MFQHPLLLHQIKTTVQQHLHNLTHIVTLQNFLFSYHHQSCTNLNQNPLSKIIGQQNIPYIENRINLKTSSEKSHNPIHSQHFSFNLISYQILHQFRTQYLYFLLNFETNFLYFFLVKCEEIIQRTSAYYCRHRQERLVLAVGLDQEKCPYMRHSLNITDIRSNCHQYAQKSCQFFVVLWVVVEIWQVWEGSRHILLQFAQSIMYFAQSLLRKITTLFLTPHTTLLNSSRNSKSSNLPNILFFILTSLLSQFFMINDYPINIQCYFPITFLGNLIDITDKCRPNMPSKLRWNTIDNNTIILNFLKIDITTIPKNISIDKFLL